MKGLLDIVSVNIAQAAVDSAAFGNVLNPIIDNIVKPIIILLVAIAVVVFVYGVIQVMIHTADEEEHKKGRMSMISGIIGFFIMLSAWGIVNLVANTVGGLQ